MVSPIASLTQALSHILFHSLVVKVPDPGGTESYVPEGQIALPQTQQTPPSGHRFRRRQRESRKVSIP